MDLSTGEIYRIVEGIIGDFIIAVADEKLYWVVKEGSIFWADLNTPGPFLSPHAGPPFEEDPLNNEWGANYTSLAIDTDGYLYVTEQITHRVYKIDVSTGVLTVLAGHFMGENFPGGFEGDGGPATQATLHLSNEMEDGITIDGAGNVYFYDSGNNRIRKVDAETGIITTVAGNGTAVNTGNGGPATDAGLNIAGGRNEGIEFITNIVIDGSGNLFAPTESYVRRVYLPLPVANQPPTIAADNTSVNATEGQIAENTGTVSDLDGDPATLSASVGTVTNNNDDTWSWRLPTSNGPDESQTVTITADDGNGGTSQISFGLTVNNVAPTIIAISLPIEPVAINDQPVNASATFIDPAETNDEPYTCSFNYEDDTGDQPGTISDNNCTGPDHTYENPGVYTVLVTITDKDDGSCTVQALEYAVIYDPEGGFVTGGGWILSPVGAYTADPELTGKANFGFVSKYKKGQSTPKGNTEFQFKAGDLNFHSNSYDWLVIAGAKAKYNGTGTINCAGNYGFMLTATDAELASNTNVDLFRIKIWDKDNGDGVIYDNKMGSDDNGYDGTEIGGGNIKIHKGKMKKEIGNDGEKAQTAASIPEHYLLNQNYPNPFNPTTTIEFALPESEFVTLKIYSTLGQELATLLSRNLDTGIYKYKWNASNQPSGIYYYQLVAGSFSQTKKLILLK